MRKLIKIEVKEISENKYSYKGIDSETNEKLFESTFEDSSEGIVEFCGAVHGLMLIKKKDWYGDVSVGNPYVKECLEKQKFKHKAKGEKISDTLRRCTIWLLEQRSGINILLHESAEEKENPSADGNDVSDKFLERKTWFNRD